MAARRVSKSAVDWAKFQSLVPKQYQTSFRQLKGKSDVFSGRVNARPAELPAIDFAKYKAAGVSAALVDNLEKAYKVVEVPYPKDINDVKGQIDALEQEMTVKSQESVQEIKGIQSVAKDYLAAAEKVPTMEQMTYEMMYDYFPEQAPDLVTVSLDFNTGFLDHGKDVTDIHYSFEDMIKTMPEELNRARALKEEKEAEQKLAEQASPAAIKG